MSISAFQKDLATGQGWEAYVVDWLRSHGIQASQPRQLPASPQEAENIAWMRANGRSEAAIARATEAAYKNALKAGWFSQYQIDVLARINKRLYRLEVKALPGYLFERPYLLVQSVKRLANKRYPVDAWIIVNQDTKELFWVHTLAAFGDLADWGTDLSLAVSVNSLYPINQWLLWGYMLKDKPRYRLRLQRHLATYLEAA